MKRNFLLTVLITIFLVACGQNTEEVLSNDLAIDEEPTTETEIDLEEKVDEPVVAEPVATPTTDEVIKQDLPELKAHYIDAGQADATLLQYADAEISYNIIYDTGNWNRNDVVNYLADQDVSTIDLIIISHPHADHIGQLAKILSTYDVGEVWMSKNTNTSNTFTEALEAVLASNADYSEPEAGEQFDIGPMGIEIVHPTSALTGDLNDDSLSVRFTYGNMNFLFTGDAYTTAEKLMLQRDPSVKADFLQLGHHGSNTSSDPAFIKAVDPDVAIYSASTNNSYGHPHPEVVSLIQNAGITLYGTDVHGTIIVTTDGNTYSVQTKADGTISPISTGAATTSTPVEEQTKAEPEVLTGDCVDINNATAEELQAIKHIGEARVIDLMEQRPYNTVDDLSRIKGIGPARITDIKNEGIACIGGS